MKTGAGIEEQENRKERGAMTWEGYELETGSFLDYEYGIVLPEKAAPGKPYVWRTEFFGAFPSVDLAMLRNGYAVIYYRISDKYGSPEAVKLMAAFQPFIQGKYGLASRAVLFGFSRGGLYALHYGAAYPERIGALYLDAPVVDIYSWPGGAFSGEGSPKEWEDCRKLWDMTHEAYMDRVAAGIHTLLAWKIPLIIVAGGKDEVVPWQENGILLQKAYEKSGAAFQLIMKPDCGHHPHSLKDPSPVAEFLLKNGVCTGIGAEKEQEGRKAGKLSFGTEMEPDGNDEKFHAENISSPKASPIKGKRLLFLGSSVTYGAAAQGVSMADYLRILDGCTVVKEAVSGTTLADRSEDSYLSRLRRVDAEQRFDAVICQLSTNDATQGIPLGCVSGSRESDTFDTATVAGALEAIIAYVQKVWDCPFVLYTGTKYESAQYRAMVDLLPFLREKRGIHVLDLWNDEEMNAVAQEDYALYMSDPIHPSQAGYLLWWTPKFQAFLYDLLA